MQKPIYIIAAAILLLFVSFAVSAQKMSSASQVLLDKTTENRQGTIQMSDETKQTFTIRGVDFSMIKVDGGTFTMGATVEQGADVASRELPTHQVTLSDYYIGATEVTQALWEVVMGANPSDNRGVDNPVNQISWDDCQTFVAKLCQLTGEHFRLPTEAEWEYAARGGNKTQRYKYAGSNMINDVAWYVKNSGATIHPVAQKQPNELGLYDMSGNVREWCLDWYGAYTENSQANPVGASSGTYRVFRGGSCKDSADYSRVARRIINVPTQKSFDLGLRVVLVP